MTSLDEPLGETPLVSGPACLPLRYYGIGWQRAP